VQKFLRQVAAAGVCLGLLPGCGGGSEAGSEAGPQAAAGPVDGSAQAAQRQQALAATGASDTAAAAAAVSVSQDDAVRLAQQASFGPSEALVADIKAAGAVNWVSAQMALSSSAYRRGGDDSIHIGVGTGDASFCKRAPQKSNPDCWRDHVSSTPLLWDFYTNATTKPDQLRQRVALALHQLLVISGVEIEGTYGMRRYQQLFLDNAFGNYRELLRKVAVSPVMGDYLDNVNNDPLLPNENFARELLQLFSIGTCQLNDDGSLKLLNGRCQPTYDNSMVRSYAFALSGWTYPAGGSAMWSCGAADVHCRYYGGDMVPAPSLRNKEQRSLLSGVVVPANAAAPAALTKVLDSLMNHPNMAPFVVTRLIRSLVASNPSPAYVKRVVAAFRSGRYTASYGGSSATFGKGSAGDLAATVAAILLDNEARSTAAGPASAGFLRPPVLQFTGAVRALNGRSDGDPFSFWLGNQLQQHIFRPPSVFSYYPPDYPVAGTTRLGPEFGIHNAGTWMARLNYLKWVTETGAAPDTSIPNAIGTSVNLAAFTASAPDAAALVDRLANLLIGHPLTGTPRDKTIAAVEVWTDRNYPADWRERRVRTAAYLVMATPDYQVQR
jgi:uncharacterized protein (DUF1800 family)